MRSPSLCVALTCLGAGAVAGCTLGQANARIDYWTKETQAHVPVGTPLATAQSFFASRGLDLRCCMSGPQIEHAYSATERHIGRLVWMEYDALVVVDVSPEQRVTRVRVFRVGVGL